VLIQYFRNVPPLALGALDFSTVVPGMGHTETIWNTIELAPYLESIGYSRYWLGEHHAGGVAHSCPETLLAMIAGLTQNIRVGTAGILLRLHSPLRVAKAIRLLAAVYPDRIDLGIARGGAGEDLEYLLRDRSRLPVDFANKVTELLSYVIGPTKFVITPSDVIPPDVWMLGSNTESMQLAALNGTAFCLAHFLAAEDVNIPSIISSYRDQFKPGVRSSEPKCTIAVAGICANSDREAETLNSRSGPISLKRTLIGGPAKWRQELELMSSQTGVREFVILDMSPSIEEKRKSYRLLADTFSLSAKGS
jgi:luciferase family oxidoreductase group 1